MKGSVIFDTLSQDHLSRARGSSSASDPSPMQKWKTSQPLIMNSLAPPPRLNYSNGIGGDPAELHSNFHACLRVGRLDRAAALVRRLRELYNPSAQELVEANNLYLMHIMDRAVAKQPGYAMNTLSTWFEVEMRDNDIQPNATTYTCMLRAAILSTQGAKRDRLIRRYMWLAEQSGILESVLASQAWTDSEHAVLAEVRPDLIGEALPEDSAPVDNSSNPIARPKAAEWAPEIKAVNQKGVGLKTVKDALSIFSGRDEVLRSIPYPGDLDGYTQEEKDTIYARLRQDRLEEDSVEASINRWREEHDNMQKMGITSALQTKPMEVLMWQWYTALVPLFKQELESINEAYDEENKGSMDDRLVSGPFLEAFKPERLAATSLIVTVSAFGSPEYYNGTKVSHLAMTIGKQLAVEHGLMVAQTVDPSSALYRNISARRLKSLLRQSKTKPAEPTDATDATGSTEQTQPMETMESTESTEPTEPMEAAEQTEAIQQGIDDMDFAVKYERSKMLEWSPMIKAKVGALCLSKILEAAKIPITREEKETRRQLTSNEPAFYHLTVYAAGRKTGMIRLHQHVLDKLKREPIRGSFGTKYPMVVEPLPWTGYKKGGYFRYPEPIIKEKKQDDAQKYYAMAAIEKGDMDQVLAGLTVLGKTAWKLNRDVFKVVTEAWNTGEPIGNIAPENPKLDLPPEPGPGASKKEIALYLVEKKRIENARTGYHSQRCFQNFQLEVARAFRDEVFYFPHNMDFRGRAYPIPPLLNHLGADLARGILTFAKGKKLGAVGLSWLKIHLSNVFGYDKASLKDRELFAMEHIKDIYDSCENPLTGGRWWLKAEDPWQCLATCYELKHAFDSPDPTQYVSHLPVHQDGTCNGLQHYAALGGDKAGAAQVNLEPGDKPSDIYSAVAEIVKKEVAEDAKKGLVYASVLDGKITRKVVKQTVMTNVYGVTFVGARQQVIKQLQDIISEEERQNVTIFKMGGYVATLIFKALGQMFNGAQDIQDWLGACANRISTALTPEQIDAVEAHSRPGASEDDPLDPRYRKKIRAKHKKKLPKDDLRAQFRATVIWTTPLKMPVVQPYRKSNAKEITTVLQYLSIVQPKPTDAIDKRKQLQAFPPNFIHSLDATHMLLSALKCNEIGLSFASVHDSFWTHAADIPVMNRVLRDAFVRMHSEDIVGRLHEEFSVRYKDCMYLATVPPRSPLGMRIVAHRHKTTGFTGPGKATLTGYAVLDELLQERTRQRLLHSTDPAERAEGEAMITPCALFEAADPGERLDLLTSDEVHVTRLGETSPEGKALAEQKSKQSKPRKNTAAKAKANTTSQDADEMNEDDHDEQSDLLEGVMGDEDLHTAMDEAEAEAEAEAEGAEGEGEEWQDAPKKKKAPRGVPIKVSFWLPMSFPPVPAKGDFDVTRLRESTYFFS